MMIYILVWMFGFAQYTTIDDVCSPAATKGKGPTIILAIKVDPSCPAQSPYQGVLGVSPAVWSNGIVQTPTVEVKIQHIECIRVQPEPRWDARTAVEKP